VTVYVTLASSDLGLWSPFSWYPYVPPSKWAAIVTEATDTSAIATLFDRGYGWVYLTSETGFETKSSITPAVLGAIEATSTTRRLQSRRLVESQPFWGCDDTLFACEPVCLKQMGAVTSKVSNTLCAGAPMDQCKCKCYHGAQWTCEGESVVCKARLGAGELETVGDKVCEMRGAKKPASTNELRIASECTPMTEMRGSSPAAECLAHWRTEESGAAAQEAAANPSESEVSHEEAAANPSESEVSPEEPLLLDESFAAGLALAAIALYA
jgi:hypothetical protein